MREISREGQVFYVYNSVKNKNKAEEIKKILPVYVSRNYSWANVSER